MLFSDFTVNDDLKFYFGYSFIIITILLVLMNLAVMSFDVYRMIKKLMWERRVTNWLIA